MKKTITLLLLLALTSCASRKTDTTKTESKVDTEVTAKETETKETEQKETNTTTETKDVVIETKEDNFEIVPIDVTKESTATFNGKTYNLKNAKLTNVNKNVLSKDNSKVISEYENELKASQKREFDYLERIKSLEQSKTKVTDKKSGMSLFILGLCLGILIVVMIWLGYVQRKKLFV